MGVYEEFLDKAGVENRKGQKDAVSLLVSLSDKEAVDSYAIQAPTGTGKSYAALLAGVHNARLGRRTIIGTSTLVLSDQYASDMTLVQKHFPEVEFFVLKGASNYYCGNKAADEMAKAGAKRKLELKQQLLRMTKSPMQTPPFWASADPDYCRECTESYLKRKETACEYARARKAALDADVVVTTHAMISVDMKLRVLSKGERDILGNVWLTIFDEAHKVASSLVFNETFSPSRLRTMDFNGVLSVMPFGRRADFVEHFSSLEKSDWYTPSPAKAKTLLGLWPTYKELGAMSNAVMKCAEKEKHDLNKNVWFLRHAREVLEEIASGNLSGDTALWSDGSKYKMQDMVVDSGTIDYIRKQRIAWISATIGTASHETYSLTKCGLDGIGFFDLESPFDFAEQMQWAARPEGRAKPQAELIAGINSYLDGGMVVLTGSHYRKDRIADTLKEKVPGLLVQRQQQGVTGDNGNSANKYAIEQHKQAAEEGESPVLVGVEVFSTGIDLPGKWLSKLVIAGLFPLRDDPAYANWRWRWIESVGGSGFDGYELPERAIALEQQIGRLIRRETDKGLVVFYVEDKDWVPGSKGEKIIREAMRRFPGAREL